MHHPFSFTLAVVFVKTKITNAKYGQASQYLTVINGAAMVVGMVPEPIIMAVTISVQVAVGTAQELQSRHRTNTYLDKMNDALFRPHGLFCMLMTYKPDAQSSSEPVMTAGLISKTITPSDSKFKEQMKMFKLTTGKSKGEMELPEAAPLVYPALEKVMEQETKTFKSSSQFVADYMDRRSAAKYVCILLDKVLIRRLVDSNCDVGIPTPDFKTQCPAGEEVCLPVQRS